MAAVCNVIYIGAGFMDFFFFLSFRTRPGGAYLSNWESETGRLPVQGQQAGGQLELSSDFKVCLGCTGDSQPAKTI